MPFKYRKYFRLTLVASLLFVVLFQLWNPLSSSGVDIRPRQGQLEQKLFSEKIEDLLIGYPDIAYHIKEDVARLVHVCNLSLRNSCFFV